MADQEANLISWLLAHKDRIGLSVERHDPSWAVPSAYCGVSVRLAKLPSEPVGVGTAKLPEVAFCKAASEAIERSAYLLANCESTNGVAAHVDRDAAVFNARAELVERDAFMCHYLTRCNPVRGVRGLAPHESKDLRESRERLESMGFRVLLGELASACDLFVVACMIVGSTEAFGSVTGLGSSRDPAIAIERAFLEAARTLSVVWNSRFSSMELESFLRLSAWTPGDHDLLAANPKSRESHTGMFFGAMRSGHQEKLRLEDIPYADLILPTELEGAPIHVVRAESRALQDLYFGPTVQSRVNLDRLRVFTGRPIQFHDLEKFPHPMG